MICEKFTILKKSSFNIDSKIQFSDFNPDYYIFGLNNDVRRYGKESLEQGAIYKKLDESGIGDYHINPNNLHKLSKFSFDINNGSDVFKNVIVLDLTSQIVFESKIVKNLQFRKKLIFKNEITEILESLYSAEELVEKYFLDGKNELKLKMIALDKFKRFLKQCQNEFDYSQCLYFN